MKKLIKVDHTQRVALAIATIIAFIAALYFLKNYIILIVLAAIVAFIFNPVYQSFIRKGRKPSSAAALTLLLTFLSIIIPLTFLIAITTVQVAHLLDVIKTNTADLDLGNLGQQIIDSINNLLKSIGIGFQLTPEYISSTLSSAVESVGSRLLENVWSSINGIFGFITIAIIYIYVFMSILINQNKITQVVHQINPLGRQISELYLQRMGSMTKAMVRGQFIIATMQGLTDAALLYLAGMHYAFFFFAIILIALSIIPLGGGILVLPIGVIMLFTGNTGIENGHG